MTEAPVRRKSYLFPLFLALFVLAHFVAVACGWDYLRDVLADYEAGRPEKPVEALLRELEEGDYGTFASLCGYEPSPYETRADFERYLRERTFGAPGELSYAPGAPDPSGTRYDILLDGERAASVTLRRAVREGTSGFGEWTLFSAETEVEAAPPCSVRAPQDASVFFNGVEAAREERARIPVEAYADPALGEAPPEEKVLAARGLLFPPEVTAEGPDGQPLEILPGDGGTDLAAVARPAGAQREEWEAVALAAARAYALFTTRDAARAQIAGYLIPGTQSAKRLAAFDNSWFIDHDAAAIEGAAADNFIVYDARRFSCDVSLTCRVRMGSKTFDYPSAYTMFFVVRAEGLKIAELRVR